MIASALEAPEPEPTRRKDSIVEQIGINPGKYGLENHGIRNAGRVFWNLSPAALIEQSLERNEGELTETGALAVRTGKRTGRSPKDRFIVQRSPSQEHIAWGSVNVPIEPGKFNALRAKVLAHLEERDLFVRDCWAGADPKYRMPIRVITEFAWHNLFAAALFVRPEAGEAAAPEFTIVVVPSFHSDPGADGTNSDAFVMIDFEQKMVLIGGMHYAGEIKKSVFSILNFLLPLKGVLSMHCSANIGEQGDVALFFGLSGTGKTTLSADPDRRLIGDDEHGWSDRGVFNFEGGCYAKCIRLSREYEPQIYNAIRFGAVVENAVIDASTRCPDYDDGSLTENTRVGYPLDYIANAVLPSVGEHPRNVVFLTCDAFGVLPPISRLTPEQAMYHFLSGYTAKVAGTEAGVTEPQTTFSSCFGSPFLPLDPTVYAGMLGKNLAEHNAACWLVNTGWTGGPYGTGERINLRQTRAIIKALLDGSLVEVPTEPDPIFGLFVPTTCPGVPAEILSPRSTWSDPSAYDKKAKDLAARFVRNFEQFTEASPAVKQAGPTECEPVS